MATTLWQVRLFGGLRLHFGERVETRFRTQKTAALLAYLALYPQRTHSREELATRFWGEDGDEEARRSLRVALNSLRRQLDATGTELLCADRATIGLRTEAFTTDVAQFEEALAKAARLARTAPQSVEERLAHILDAADRYEAPLLPGFYDDWVLTERERLHSRFLDASEEAERLLRRLQRYQEADAVAVRREQSVSSDTVVRAGNAEAKAPITVNNDARREQLPKAPLLDAGNLPVFLDRFLGREEEMATLQRAWDDPRMRLITLAGLSGIGKTRLAVEAARRLRADAIYVPFASAESVAVSLKERAIAGACPLLVVDDVEAREEPLWESLLRRFPEARCLVAARQPIGTTDEVVVPVAALALPEESETDPATLLKNASLALFVDRARTVTPRFALTGQNTPGLVCLMQLLGGVPLAIELAAAWSSVLSPPQMVAMLRGGEEPCSALERTIAWSYDLLPRDLRALWRQLGVFEGGFTAAMAETAAGTTFTRNGLARLRERAVLRLVEQTDGADHEPLYHLPKPLRVFARRQRSAEETAETLPPKFA